MQLKETLQAAAARLEAAHVGSPRLNAETLLMFVLGCDRAYLHAHSDRVLTSEEFSRYEDALSRRATGMPAQYITGRQEFWGMDFAVNPSVLIPRPETEHLIEAILPRAKAIRRCRIVDVGTGSGAIALVLAGELPDAEIYATDISPEALVVARENAVHNRLESRVRWQQADLLEGLELCQFDLVVSNPPYVGESEEDEVQLEVRKFEPRRAVFSGPSGLEVIERLIPQAWRALKPGGMLAMEISGSIAEGVARLLQDWREVAFALDLQGIQRVVTAQRP